MSPRSAYILFATLLFATTATAQSPDPQVRDMVQRGLAHLTKVTLDWKSAHSCASCHHAPLMLWSSYFAKRKGYAVDESAVDTVRDWLLSEGDKARLVAPKEPADRYIFSVAAAYTTLALAEAPPATAPPDLIKRFRDHYIEVQQPDGGFLINGTFSGTAPILEAGSNAACLARLAYAALPGLTADHVVSDARVAAWLEKPPAQQSQQERALRLLVAARITHPLTLEAECMEMLSLQNPDGGWSQNAERESDAYATGQALLALATAGMKSDAPPIAEAIAYLARTQLPPGNWKMISRTVGPKGEHANNLEPIETAATAWALIGALSAT